MTTLVLVRHGETTWNAEQRAQGQQDSDLTPLGREQARLAADRVADSGSVAVYSSDLRRAAECADLIGDRLGLAVETTPALRERCAGAWEGLTWPEIVERFADAAEAAAEGRDFTPPGAETRQAMRERVVEFLDRVVAHHRGDVVIAVTHGGVINIMIRHLLGGSLVPGGRTRSENGSISVLTHDGERWRLDIFNDTCHLREREVQREAPVGLRLLEHE